jgi:hypothetical protein
MIQVFKSSYFYPEAERMSRTKLRENYLWDSLGFQAQFEDLRLKYCIQKENAKNTLSGSNVHASLWSNPEEKGKKLAGGLMVLSDVGFRFRAKLRAKSFLGAFLAKQKTPSFLEGTSVFSGEHSSDLWFPPGFSVADGA